MLKNLLEQQAANKPEQTEPETAKVTREPTSEAVDAPQYVEVNEAEDLFENSETITATAVSEESEFESVENIKSQIETPAETTDFAEPHSAPLTGTADETADFTEQKFDSAENLFGETKGTTDEIIPPVETGNETSDSTVSSENLDQETKTEDASTIFQTTAKPQSFAETARQSGLAYAAAITLFASVVFMLIIGWFADLLFGSSPWGKVGGIVLGALIGFIQLFRITSQIFKK